MPIDLSLTRDDLELLAAGSAAVAVLALLLALLALARSRALGKRVRRLTAAGAAPAPATTSTGDGPARPDPTALRRVGVVRYDAFGDMGGRLSFSAALLDDNGDGLVLSSINGRSETRTYAKSLRRLASEQRLSPEEDKAIAQALREGDDEPGADRPRPGERPAR